MSSGRCTNLHATATTSHSLIAPCLSWYQAVRDESAKRCTRLRTLLACIALLFLEWTPRSPSCRIFPSCLQKCHTQNVDVARYSGSAGPFPCTRTRSSLPSCVLPGAGDQRPLYVCCKACLCIKFQSFGHAGRRGTQLC